MERFILHPLSNCSIFNFFIHAVRMQKSPLLLYFRISAAELQLFPDMCKYWVKKVRFLLFLVQTGTFRATLKAANQASKRKKIPSYNFIFLYNF